MSEHGSPAAPAEQKPKTDDNTLNIKIVSTDGNEVFFKIKKTTKLNKLKHARRARDNLYCRTPYDQMRTQDADIRPLTLTEWALTSHRSAHALTGSLLFDGVRIGDDQTALDLDMEEGDSIDVLLEQVGGY